jgi:glutathionylspermidine synthase
VKRIPITPRGDWQKTVEAQGFLFHTVEEQPYWDESAYYSFTSAEINTLESATYELDRICLATVERIVNDPALLAHFDVPPDWVDYVKASWESDEITIYGRFDLAYDGTGPPKMIEYNADTPTALLEAAVIQWYWLKDRFPQRDQFNSIHERLIEAWKRYQPLMRGEMIYFASMDNTEDFMTATYLQDTATQAGLSTQHIQVHDIGWHQRRGVFTDLNEQEICQIFKLYPWEWLMRDQFGPFIKTSATKWLEAPWKMLLSNKAILPVLWELFPNHPNLLPAAFEPMDAPFVRKPAQAREGSNVYIQIDADTIVETGGKYAAPYVYQRYCKLPNFDGNNVIIGSWMVNGYACGIGIREDPSLITGNFSRFVPHTFS